MIGPDPAANPKTSLAITFWVEVQLSAGRPGKEATPAKHGVMRVPSAGKLESGAEVRTIIQCWLSQLFPGKAHVPLKVAPALMLIVSPQADPLSAACNPAVSDTGHVLPVAGEFAIALWI